MPLNLVNSKVRVWYSMLYPYQVVLQQLPGTDSSLSLFQVKLTSVLIILLWEEKLGNVDL